MSAALLRSLLALLVAWGLAACGSPPEGREPDEAVSTTVRGLSVDGVAAAGGCSTAAVLPLSEQILQVMNCLRPGIVAPVPDRANLSLGPAVIPYLETPARDRLVETLDAHPGTTMDVSSMMRTVASQYLLYYWYQHGQCGIEIAATPGTSNHESGLALDVTNYATWQTALEAHDFTWYGTGDDVHYTYAGAGAVDLRADGVTAFQRLWNHNHPADLLVVDGDYGPQTEARLRQSPQDGFPGVPPCAQQDAGVPADAAPADDAAPPGDDAGADDAGPEAGAPEDDAGVDGPPPGDAAPPAPDAAPDAAVAGACGCAAAPAPGGAALALSVLVLAGLRRRRVPLSPLRR
ncbi:MAG TPA: M15 family metallopeptidase [Polyangia bacterium]|jgi:MYXO-CTERM domain-containing protein